MPRVIGKQQRFVRKGFLGFFARYTVLVHTLAGVASVPFETVDVRQNVHAMYMSEIYTRRNPYRATARGLLGMR